MYSSKLSSILAVAFSASALGLPSLIKRTTPATADQFAELHRAADLSSAAYSGCTGTAFDVTITLQIDDSTTDTQGFVGYSTQYERISVVMRGSTSPTDFINDLDTSSTYPVLSGVTFPVGTLVMNGVYNPWAAVHDDIITEVKSLIAQYPTYSLESTGHSLGGSLTYLSYIALAQNFPDKNVTSNSLNQFPIGNQVFADFGTSQGGLIRRGTNKGDGVPNMYTDKFYHYGEEIYGDGTLATTVQCDGERDLSCSAGDGAFSVNIDHLSNSGVTMLLAGCS